MEQSQLKCLGLTGKLAVLRNTEQKRPLLEGARHEVLAFPKGLGRQACVVWGGWRPGDPGPRHSRLEAAAREGTQALPQGRAQHSPP